MAYQATHTCVSYTAKWNEYCKLYFPTMWSIPSVVEDFRIAA